jgi:hypothetical protein
MDYGLMLKLMGIAAFEGKMRVKVNSAGMFIHKKYLFLGASPDGVVIFPSGEKPLQEVKCPFTAKGLIMTKRMEI